MPLGVGVDSSPSGCRFRSEWVSIPLGVVSMPLGVVFDSSQGGNRLLSTTIQLPPWPASRGTSAQVALRARHRRSRIAHGHAAIEDEEAGDFFPARSYR